MRYKCSMYHIIDALKSLIFPTTCELCAQSTIPICSRCAHLLSSSGKPIYGFSEAVAAGYVYNEASARIILRAKERGIRSAQQALALSLWSAFSLLHITEPKVALVPVPSSKEAIRRRGRNFIIDLLQEFVALQNTTSKSKPRISLEIHDVLIHQRKVRDQSGLTMNQRLRNMDHALMVREKIDIPTVIVDDVITTGATLKAAFSALNVAKATILGGIAACASPQQMRIR